VSVLVGVAGMVAAAPAGAASAAVGKAALPSARFITHSATTRSSAYNWSELHGNPQLTGVAANSTISTANAASLGVRWSTDLYGSIWDSPVVAYNATLGKTLVYIGTNNGIFYALDQATGSIVWSVKLNGPITASPLVSSGSVWVGTQFSPLLYKLNATTGALQCQAALPGVMDATPVAATPPGGVASIYAASGRKAFAVTQATCAIQWTNTSALDAIWDPMSYAVNATGVPLVLFGDADPDQSAFAVNALTGALVWKYATTTGGDNDVGSGITISKPGVNGFKDGVAYAPAKDGYVYAIDLTTGKKVWTASLGTRSGTPNESLSTAALVGNTLVVGQAIGVTAFNATTGAQLWTYTDPVDSQLFPQEPPEVVSSPAICGPAGQRVVSYADLGGYFRVLSVATGAPLDTYQMGTTWATSSPAPTKSDILLGSADGFLYDLAPGFGHETPATAITSPTYGANLTNPGGQLTVSGTASDSAGVGSVVVAIRQGGSYGTWWNPATSGWSATPVTMKATLTTPNATSTNWTAAFPVPPSGNTYQVDAYTVSTSGPSAAPAAVDDFYVDPVSGGPTLQGPVFAGPGTTQYVHGSGYSAGESVSVSLLGTVLVTAKATSAGSFGPVKVTIPVTAGFGPTALVATGATSGKSASSSFDVANSWTDQGGGPAHTGFEANDPIPDLTISPGDNILLAGAWSASSGGSALTAPVVAKQVAYTGSQAGTLYAVRAHDGRTLWTWHTPDSAAITSAPAIDASANVAFVGAADGTLYAVHTAGSAAGTLAWSAPVGTGTVESPVLDGANVYAASTGGALSAFSESAGTKLWSVTTPNAVTAAPALDAAAKLLLVPTNGALVEYKTGTGASVWSFTAPGLATPVISGGSVYVGSSNGDEYAVSESAGTQTWSFATGAAVDDSAALNYSAGAATQLWVGSSNGDIYELNPATGAKDQLVPTTSNVTGVAISGSMAFVTNAGGVVRTFRIGNKVNSLIWTYQTQDGSLGAPAVVDGTVYVAGQKGNLWAYTPYGAPPM
jgi:outer membrane protein assembly factor BamB